MVTVMDIRIPHITLIVLQDIIVSRQINKVTQKYKREGKYPSLFHFIIELLNSSQQSLQKIQVILILVLRPVIIHHHIPLRHQ